jgi:hypothetical protein
MTESSEESYANLTVDDLTANGISVPDDIATAETFQFQPDQFKECNLVPDRPLPAIIIKTREGVFHAYSLRPVISNEPPRKFEIQEGTGESPNTAKEQCLTRTIKKFNGEAETIDEYLKERAATEVAGDHIAEFFAFVREHLQKEIREKRSRENKALEHGIWEKRKAEGYGKRKRPIKYPIYEGRIQGSAQELLEIRRIEEIFNILLSRETEVSGWIQNVRKKRLPHVSDETLEENGKRALLYAEVLGQLKTHYTEILLAKLMPYLSDPSEIQIDDLVQALIISYRPFGEKLVEAIHDVTLPKSD